MVKALQGVCFHPDTIIETENGKYIISEIPLESKLTNGAIVQSRMLISNIKENGLYREDLYEVKGNKHDIVVSGSHLIYNPNLKKYMSETYTSPKSACMPLHNTSRVGERGLEPRNCSTHLC